MKVTSIYVSPCAPLRAARLPVVRCASAVLVRVMSSPTGATSMPASSSPALSTFARTSSCSSRVLSCRFAPPAKPVTELQPYFIRARKIAWEYVPPLLPPATVVLGKAEI